MIALSANSGSEQIFGPAVVWAHCHQGHLTTLVEAACKLALLMDDGPDWPYAFVLLSNTTCHMPLSDAGHLGTMTDSTQSVNTCSCLHQLQTWKLLQHREHVVFPEGLNGEMEAHHFSFPELSPWDTATAGRSAWELPPIEMILGGVEHESMLTIPPSPASSVPASHHTTLGGKSPYEALGDLPPSQMKNLLGLEDMDWHLHVPMATSQASLGNATLRHSSAIIQVSHSSSLATMSKSPGATSTPSDHQPQVPARAGLSNIPQEVAQLQKEMNVALGQLLTMEAALDSHQRELEWDLDYTMQQCEAQATRAIQEAEILYTATIKEVEACHMATIKEAEDHHTTQVHALQQSHREGILNFKHKALEKEECTCLMFLEACGATLRACPIEAHRVLLYPLHFLMGNILLASLLTVTLQPAHPMREPPFTVPPPLASKPPSSPTGTKWQHHPSWEEATGSAASAKEPSCWRQKEGKPLAGLKETTKWPFVRMLTLSRPPGGHILRCITLLSTRRGPMISPVFFGR